MLFVHFNWQQKVAALIHGRLTIAFSTGRQLLNMLCVVLAKPFRFCNIFKKPLLKVVTLKPTISETLVV